MYYDIIINYGDFNSNYHHRNSVRYHWATTPLIIDLYFYFSGSVYIDNVVVQPTQCQTVTTFFEKGKTHILPKIEE